MKEQQQWSTWRSSAWAKSVQHSQAHGIEPDSMWPWQHASSTAARSSPLRRASACAACRCPRHWSTARAVVVADPLDTIDNLFAGVGSDGRGAVIIDASPGDPDLGRAPSAPARRPGAAVYRAFNTLMWTDFVDPDYGGTVPDLFYAGPDDEPANRSKDWWRASGSGRSTSAGTSRSNWSTSLAALRSGRGRSPARPRRRGEAPRTGHVTADRRAARDRR